MKKVTLTLTALALTAASYAQTWSVDKAHSRVGFGINHLGINMIQGDFKVFDSKISSSKADFSDATITFSADMNSINTDIEARDKHLKSADFFDAEKNPQLTFKSTSFSKKKGNEYKVTGELTMHGITKAVTFDAVLVGTTVHPMNKKEMAGFRLRGTINRNDYKIAPSMPSPMLGDNVELIADTEFSKD